MLNELKKQTEILKEILKWTKISGLENIKKKISDEFHENNKILVYSLSDGRSIYDIEKILNKKVTGMTVSNWWKSWSKQGLMEIHPDYKKRYKSIFNLEDFGIIVPEIKTQEKSEDKKEENQPDQVSEDNINGDLENEQGL
jgi:hypothetical protein